MKLIVIPYGGLANRMRAIDSAINIQKDNFCKVHVYWHQDSSCRCKFSDVFEPMDLVTDLSTERKFNLLLRILVKGRKGVFSLLFRFLSLIRVFKYFPTEDIDGQYEFATPRGKRYLFVVMETWEYFYEKDKVNTDFLKIKPNKTLDNLLTHIDEKTVGVHIRRTDHKLSIQNSPLELFEDAMQMEISKDPDTNFLICTDDESVKKYFRESGKYKAYIPQGELSRNSSDGIQQAVGEMYALSKTKKILGSYWSSFSLMAAKLGGIDVDVICKNE